MMRMRTTVTPVSVCDASCLPSSRPHSLHHAPIAFFFVAIRYRNARCPTPIRHCR
jgi:hypothetical protein